MIWLLDTSPSLYSHAILPNSLSTSASFNSWKLLIFFHTFRALAQSSVSAENILIHSAHLCNSQPSFPCQLKQHFLRKSFFTPKDQVRILLYIPIVLVTFSYSLYYNYNQLFITLMSLFLCQTVSSMRQGTIICVVDHCVTSLLKYLVLKAGIQKMVVSLT